MKTITAIKTTATTYTRVAAGTAGAVKLPLWSVVGKYRTPRMGETFDTFRDVSTLYAVCYR
jgi:hypothetical protein